MRDLPINVHSRGKCWNGQQESIFIVMFVCYCSHLRRADECLYHISILRKSNIFSNFCHQTLLSNDALESEPHQLKRYFPPDFYEDKENNQNNVFEIN